MENHRLILVELVGSGPFVDHRVERNVFQALFRIGNRYRAADMLLVVLLGEANVDDRHALLLHVCDL